MNYSFLPSAIGVIAIAGIVLAAPATSLEQNPDPNHTHADFAVWIDGQKLDFSADTYMSNPVDDPIDGPMTYKFIPTAVAHDGVDDGHPDEVTLPGRKYLHLHDGNGSVIHRHKPGLTLGDFFASIGFTMTTDCFTLDTKEQYCNTGKKHWRMFVNAKEVPMNPGYDFADNDKILLTYSAADSVPQEQLDQLTDDACRYSKTCPWRGDPPTENCIADPTVPCVVQ